MRKTAANRRNRNRRFSSQVVGLERLEDRRLMSADFAAPVAVPSAAIVSPPVSTPVGNPNSGSGLLDRVVTISITNANIASQDDGSLESRADQTRTQVFALAASPLSSIVLAAPLHPHFVAKPLLPIHAQALQSRAAISANAFRPLPQGPRASYIPRRIHLTGNLESDQQALVRFRESNPAPYDPQAQTSLQEFGDNVESFGKKVEKFGRKIGEAFKDIF